MASTGSQWGQGRGLSARLDVQQPRIARDLGAEFLACRLRRPQRLELPNDHPVARDAFRGHADHLDRITRAVELFAVLRGSRVGGGLLQVESHDHGPTHFLAIKTDRWADGLLRLRGFFDLRCDADGIRWSNLDRGRLLDDRGFLGIGLGRELVTCSGAVLQRICGLRRGVRADLGLLHLSGNYTRVDEQVNSPNYPTLDLGNTSGWRHHLNLIGRYFVSPQNRVSAYGQAGLNVSFGRVNNAIRTGVGPMAGIGLETAVSERVGFFLELDGIWVFSDEAMDLADPRTSSDSRNFDAFTFFGFGVRVNLGSSLLPTGR